MKKLLNIRNIVILVVGLAVLHFGIGLIVSPMASPFVVAAINKTAGTKVSVERVNVWPLTLSFGLKNLKVFDPQKADMLILNVKDASVRLSVLGLLSKRLVVSSLNMNGAEINLEGEPDGTFNIQKLAQQKAAGEAKPQAGLLEMFKGKKDWFSKIYDLLKKKFSKDALAKKKEKALGAKKITKDVANLPKGRVVHFKTAAGRYLIEVRSLVINDLSVKLKAQDGREIEIDKATLRAGNAGFDPELGSRLGSFSLTGGVMNKGVAAGSLDLRYVTTSTRDKEKAEINVNLKGINLDAVRFIYEDSLPVEVAKGTLDLSSKTNIINEALDSKNSLSLSNHELKAKGLIGQQAGFMPIPTICDGLNSMVQANLSFTIFGTVDRPEFSGFMKSLTDLIKPNLKSLAPGKGEVSKAIGSIQSLFGAKK